MGIPGTAWVDHVRKGVLSQRSQRKSRLSPVVLPFPKTHNGYPCVLLIQWVYKQIKPEWPTFHCGVGLCNAVGLRASQTLGLCLVAQCFQSACNTCLSFSLWHDWWPSKASFFFIVISFFLPIPHLIPMTCCWEANISLEDAFVHQSRVIRHPTQIKPQDRTRLSSPSHATRIG